jgi:hypothetical protein
VYTGKLARRLNEWIEKRGAISECQMGFRKGRTADNIFTFWTTIDKYHRGRGAKFVGYS